MLVISAILAFYLAFNLGANDVANAMGTSVGAKSITLRQALVLAGVLEFVGALWLGQDVSLKLMNGVVDLSVAAPSPAVWIQAMLAVLVATGVWLNLATVAGLPVSSSHAVVGAIAGVGLVVAGPGAVNWQNLGWISLAWVLTPLVTGAIGALLFALLPRNGGMGRDLPAEATKDLGGDLADKAGDSESPEQAEIEPRRSPYANLQVLSAAGVAFAHGANDVGNAVAPLGAIAAILATQALPTASFQLPLWSLAVGGGGIGVGLAVLGRKVIATIGDQITALDPASGFCAELATTVVVLGASHLGLPVSTSHGIVGAITGIGLSRGNAVNWGTLRSIALTWLVTIPAAMGLAMGVFWGLGWVMGA